jgi:translation initiation factor IF-1
MQYNADGAPLRSSMRRFALLALLAIVSTSIVLAARAAEFTFDLRVEDGRVPESMRLIRVKQGDVVTLQWTVDRPLLLHLHGYDIEWRVQPGTVGKVSFTARLTGRFPVHAHDTGTRANEHAHEDSPLVYVEVYPR